MSTAPITSSHVPPDTLPMRLVIARTYAGLTAKEAGLRCGVSGQTWRNWEDGKTIARREATLEYVAKQLGVDPDWLINGGPLGNEEAPRPERPGGLGGCTARDSDPEPADYGPACALELELIAA